MSKAIDDKSCELLGGFCTIFAHATRMRIFCVLQHGPKTVTEIADDAGMSITNASQHLRLMKDKGAVIAEKHAQSVLYQIADPRFMQAAILIREALLDRMRQGVRKVSAPAPRSERTRVAKRA